MLKNIRDLYRGISNFKNVYQTRINLVKNMNGVLVTDCNSILARWKEHLSQPLNVHGFIHVRQKEIHTAEPLVPEPSAFVFELAIEKLKKTTHHQVLIKSQRS